MRTRDIILSGLGCAALIALYIGVFALVVPSIPNYIDHIPQLGMTVFPMIFVLSAAITGTLFLGRPVAWYLEGKRKEAWQHISATIGFLFIFIVIITMVFAIFAPRTQCRSQDGADRCVIAH